MDDNLELKWQLNYNLTGKNLAAYNYNCLYKESYYNQR